MWRSPASRKGRHIVNAARKLATESASPKQNVPSPSPQAQSKSVVLRTMKFVGLSLPVAAGGAVGYAWYDPDFRKQLEDSVPYAKELLENILPKEDESVPVPARVQPASSFEKPKVINTQDTASKGSTLHNFSTKADDKSLSTAMKKEPSHQVTQKRSDKISPSAIEAQIHRKEEDEKADNAALEVVIHKLVTNSQNLIAEAVKAQSEAAACVRKHTELLKRAMDDTSDILQKDAQWQGVAVAQKEKELATMRATELVSESKKSVEKLKDVLQEGKSSRITQNNPAIFPATKQLAEFLKQLGNANLQIRNAEAEANVMQKYKDVLDKGKREFQKELETLNPGTTFSSGKKLTEEELNALIVHAHRRIEQLQKQIAEQLAMERQRLGAALEFQRLEDLKIANAAVAEERQRLKEEFEVDKSKTDMEYLVRVETEVRKQLARQAAAHSDHLKDVLSAQQQELSTEYNKSLQNKLLEERGKFQSEVAGWITRLKGIETAVEARATSEKLARCAQDLWLACIALNSVIHFGGNKENEERQLVPLRENVELILQAGQKHPFVETVANTFPYIALDRGVNTEDELRHRFYRVSRICRRLGLVDTTSPSLYKYLISFLHSFVVLDNVVATIEKGEIDLTALDNFSLLAHAQYWMEKGNLDLALRFMIQLTGESQRAASGWIDEARLLLETKQIAYTLIAYASATGLANTNFS